jgi:hypothetical protein
MRKNTNRIKPIQEALGVPQNIYETAVQLYDKLLKATKKLNKKSDFENYGARLVFRGQFEISDFPFSTIKFLLGVEEIKKITEPEIMSMTMRSESKKTGYSLQTIKSKSLDMMAIIVVPKNYDYSKLTEFFLKNKKDIVESLSHELKHAYDHFKKPFDSVSERGNYQGIVGKQFGIPSIDTFLHDIYYTSAIENLVRPTEVYSAIRNNEISQKDFLNFLRNNDTYLNLKRISQFDLSQLKTKLKSEMKQIDRFLKSVDVDIENMSDLKKINSVLKLTWLNVTNWQNESLKEVMATDFFEQLLGFEGEKEKFFRKLTSRNENFKNFAEFFSSYQKYFHFISNQMIRKIAKLYAFTNKS